LANSHRFARGVMALESGLYHNTAATLAPTSSEASPGSGQDRVSSNETEARPGDRAADMGAKARDHGAGMATSSRDHDAAMETALHAFSADVETTLRALSAALRDSAALPDALPDLRADQRAVADHAGVDAERSNGEPPPSSQLALLATETDRITDSVNTLAGLVRA
jgi:hypothetical protein